MVVASQPAELTALVSSSAASLGLEPLAEQPSGFPDNALFGRTSDAWVALWSEGNVFASILLLDDAGSSEPMLIALAQALLALLAS